MAEENAGTATWFYEQDGERKGPVTEAAMIAMIQARTISYGTLVWQAGFPEWLKAQDTVLRPHLEAIAPPPLAGKHVGSGLVWLLAFAPLLGYLLEGVVAYAVNNNDASAQAALEGNSYWYLTLALNLGLSYFDERRLKRAGYDTSTFQGMAWLVPVYLFKRAKALHHSLAYFIVWLVSFALSLAV